MPSARNSEFNDSPKENTGFKKLFREEDEDNLNYQEEGMTFEQMFEGSLSSEEIQEGQIVKGKIVSIGAESILVDIGHKAEGEIPTQEFKAPDGSLSIKEGDTVEVLLEKIETEKGLLKLSKNRADLVRVWDEIAEACKSGQIVEGTVLGAVRSGLTVDIGVKAFLPASQIDVRPIKNLDQFIGKTLKCQVIKFNKKRGNIVLSRRAVMEEQREGLKASTLSQIKVGAIVRGTIKNITDYGAFVDLGGLDGLLHVTDMSWGRVKHPQEIIEVGQEINVRVLKFDTAKERVSLGLKQTQPDPWQDIQDRFLPGQRIEGKVVSLTDYGAFIEIETGVEGLIHVSEMSWTQRIRDPRKLLKEGDSVESVVLDIDLDNRRMSLGLKQATPNPWDSLEHKYPPGSKVSGVIKNITDFGLFVEIEEGIDGLVHVSDLSWDENVSSPSESFEKGQNLEAVVLNIDKENERVSLSVKLLSGDPWTEFLEANKVGSIIEGTVTKLANFGAFVEIAKNIEGMVHVSELSDERIMHPESVVKVGDKIKAEIINLDTRERKISLSVKALSNREEREAIESYKSTSESSPKSSLADTLNPEIAAKLGLLNNSEESDS